MFIIYDSKKCFIERKERKIFKIVFTREKNKLFKILITNFVKRSEKEEFVLH